MISCDCIGTGARDAQAERLLIRDGRCSHDSVRERERERERRVCECVKGVCACEAARDLEKQAPQLACHAPWLVYSGGMCPLIERNQCHADQIPRERERESIEQA